MLTCIKSIGIFLAAKQQGSSSSWSRGNAATCWSPWGTAALFATAQKEEERKTTERMNSTRHWCSRWEATDRPTNGTSQHFWRRSFRLTAALLSPLPRRKPASLLEWSCRSSRNQWRVNESATFYCFFSDRLLKRENNNTTQHEMEGKVHNWQPLVSRGEENKLLHRRRTDGWMDDEKKDHE